MASVHIVQTTGSSNYRYRTRRRTDGWTDGRTDRRTDGRTDEQDRYVGRWAGKTDKIYKKTDESAYVTKKLYSSVAYKYNFPLAMATTGGLQHVLKKRTADISENAQ